MITFNCFIIKTDNVFNQSFRIILRYIIFKFMETFNSNYSKIAAVSMALCDIPSHFWST